MDLGQVLVGAVKTGLEGLIAKELGGTPSSPYVTTPALRIPGTEYEIEGDIPFMDIARARKPRRRRRRLATVSDIKDLAALKAVLGAGEAFKTWIATHSR